MPNSKTTSSPRKEAGVPDMSVALRPNEIESVPSLVGDIQRLARGDVADEATRLEMADKATALANSLRTPRETMILHCWAQVRMPSWD